METVATKWLDDEKPAASDPEAIRSRLAAKRVDTYMRQEATQATPPVDAPGTSLSQAASRRSKKGPGNVGMAPAEGLEKPGVGLRALRATQGDREANKW